MREYFLEQHLEEEVLSRRRHVTKVFHVGKPGGEAQEQKHEGARHLAVPRVPCASPPSTPCEAL